MSNVEQLDVLNGPIMTAEHVGHMDGPHWDLTVGKRPNTLKLERDRKGKREQVDERSKGLQDETNLIPLLFFFLFK